MENIELSESFSSVPRLGVMQIPALGIGTYQLRGEECTHSVKEAIKIGYRLIDTAAVYRNEELVGKGICESGIDRAELFIIVKIAMKSMHDAEAIRTGICTSIHKLCIGYADLVLIHWPGCGKKKPEDAEAHHSARIRCWEVMCDLQKEGKVRYLGVSNFLPRHFDAIEPVITHQQREFAANMTIHKNKHNEHNAIAKVSQEEMFKPQLNQIELHPLCLQTDIVSYCRAHDIVVQQYSPLGNGNAHLLQHPKLVEIVQSQFAFFSVPEVLVMWGLAQGYSVLVRSKSECHLRANWNAALTFFNKCCTNEGNTCGGGDADFSTEFNKNNSSSVEDNLQQIRCLTPSQRETVANLHHLLGVKEDEHMCWFSNQIAEERVSVLNKV